jgi:hypothetical protein
MPAATIPLAEIRRTRTFARLIRGGAGKTREECWGAETADGVWDFEREESAGTPWLVYHRPSVKDGSWTLPVVFCGTLRACRALVASGGADEELARRLAETAPGA